MLINDATLSLIIINCITTMPPTIAAVAALMAARKSPADTTKQFAMLEASIRGLQSSLMKHLNDRNAHRK